MARGNVAQLRLLMDQGAHWGYFLEPYKLLFIKDSPGEKEAARQEFERVGLHITYIDGSRYLGDYLGTSEELETWVRPKVEAWAHGVHTLDKISKRYPQLAYAGLGMPLHLEWHYLQRTVPGVSIQIGPVEDSLRDAFFPTILGGGMSAPSS